MKLDDGRLSFVAQQEVTALDAIHKAVLGKAACAGRVTEGVGTCISIHAPTWGATYNPNHVAPPEIFQSTHPRGVRHKAGDDVIKHRVFQSTHPRGVRLILSIQEWWARNFNPRTHVGCDQKYQFWAMEISSFQSTHPRGVRRWPEYRLTPSTNFNPRTHVGCDDGHGAADVGGAISIHAPTWGATFAFLALSLSGYFNPRTHVGCDLQPRRVVRPRPISIHAPTWGATHCQLQWRRDHFHFNPRTHVGCDVAEVSNAVVHLDISIHAPTWGATRPQITKKQSYEFQSTHPRGVRLKTVEEAEEYILFQSTHPRGVRRGGTRSKTFQNAFQSTHPRGVRHSRLSGRPSHTYFNPRTHVGCDGGGLR